MKNLILTVAIIFSAGILSAQSQSARIYFKNIVHKIFYYTFIQQNDGTYAKVRIFDQENILKNLEKDIAKNTPDASGFEKYFIDLAFTGKRWVVLHSSITPQKELASKPK